MTKKQKSDYDHKYYLANRDRILAARADYRERNREACNEYNRNYYAKNREAILASRKAKKIARENELAYKRAYARQWYLANKMYKKTYGRLYSQLGTALNRGDADTAIRINNTLDTIIIDRKSQIRKGRWFDQRTGNIYVGIHWSRV